MFETAEDTAAMIDLDDNAIEVAIVGQAGSFAAVFTRRFDSSLDINGRNTSMRITNETYDEFEPAVGNVVLIFKNTNDEQNLTIRAIERAQRTTLLILEAEQ